MPHKDPEARRAYHAAYRAAHRDKMNEQTKEWVAKNRERVRENQHRWYLENYDLTNQRANERYHGKVKPSVEGMAKMNAVQNAWRARQSNAPVVDLMSVEEYNVSIRKMDTVECAYCGKEVPGKRVFIDHIIPLQRGGPHAVSNLCPCCVSCNTSKGRLLLEEWRPDLVRLT